MWKVLRGSGIPELVLKRLQDVHTDTGANAKVLSGRKLSRWFCMSSDVLQYIVFPKSSFTQTLIYFIPFPAPGSESHMTATSKNLRLLTKRHTFRYPALCMSPALICINVRCHA